MFNRVVVVSFVLAFASTCASVPDRIGPAGRSNRHAVDQKVVTNSVPSGVQALLEQNRNRIKELERQMRSIDDRQKKLFFQWKKAEQRHRTDEAAFLRREQDAVAAQKTEMFEVLRLLTGIPDMARRGDLSPTTLESRVAWHHSEWDYRLNELSTKVSQTVSRHNADVASHERTEIIEISRRVVDAYREAHSLCEQRFTLWNQLLAAAGSTMTVAGIRSRVDKANERERDRYIATYRNIQNGGASYNKDTDNFTNLVIAIGVAAAIAKVLTSSESTPADKAAATKRLEDERGRMRRMCESQHRRYVEGVGSQYGSCGASYW
jgi:hypothetical protein